MNALSPLPRMQDRHTAVDAVRFREIGMWSDDVLPDIVERNARRNPDGLCVADGRTEITFDQARDRAWSLAGALAELGIEPGDRVVVQLPNVSEAVITYYAIARLGAVLVPRMPIYRHREMLDTVRRTGAKAIIVADRHRGFDHAQMAVSVAEASPSVSSVVVLGEAPRGAIRWDSLIASTPYDGPSPSADDVHVILFTSGSTADPKGVVHTFNTFAACARGINAVLHHDDTRRAFVTSPVMHLTGLNSGVLSAALGGFAAVIQPIWEPTQALELITRYGCTHSNGATPFVVMLADAYRPAQHDLSRFRIFGCGGAPIPPAVVHRADQELGCQLVALYGQTEACLHTMTRLDDSVERVATSDGRPVPGAEIVLLDEHAAPVATGAEGEVCSRSPSVMLGYWQDPAATDAAFDAAGWFHSGDLGRMDSHGYLRITGRKKDIISRGGVKIAAREIEEILLEHPEGPNDRPAVELKARMKRTDGDGYSGRGQSHCGHRFAARAAPGTIGADFPHHAGIFRDGSAGHEYRGPSQGAQVPTRGV